MVLIICLILHLFDFQGLKKTKYFKLVKVIVTLMHCTTDCSSDAGALFQRRLRFIVLGRDSFSWRCICSCSVFPWELAIPSGLLRNRAFIFLMAGQLANHLTTKRGL